MDDSFLDEIADDSAADSSPGGNTFFSEIMIDNAEPSNVQTENPILETN